MEKDIWLDWAIELQSLAQAGLTYGKDKFDLERYERIREISAEIIANKSGLDSEKVKTLFCNEIGYQTPKIDTRAAIFKEDKILLLKENTIKEVKEESGLDVTADKIIAVQDREKHNKPRYAYKVCKIFVLCTATGGEFKENTETVGFDYFSLDSLPSLATEKNNEEQIKMCFEAHESNNWETVFD